MALGNNKNPDHCHGQCGQLLSCSDPKKISPMVRWKNRLKVRLSNLLWRLKTKGFWTTAIIVCRKVLNMDNPVLDKTAIKSLSPEEILNLQPGDWVEVKSEEEILGMLDKDLKYKGLRWMAGMNKHCGKQYRVLKRLETMLLESTGEYRKVKNTVLLEGAMCDGSPFNGCDRSCFFFWREAWLKRVQK